MFKIVVKKAREFNFEVFGWNGVRDGMGDELCGGYCVGIFLGNLYDMGCFLIGGAL